MGVLQRLSREEPADGVPDGVVGRLPPLLRLLRALCGLALLLLLPATAEQTRDAAPSGAISSKRCSSTLSISTRGTYLVFGVSF